MFHTSEMASMMNAGRSILLVWLCICASIVARALDPSKRISQYAHTAWRVQDGAFSGAPNTITQTKDGYLWIGTDGGLVRFDGARFTPWSPPNGKPLPDPRIYSLLGAHDGSLWIGTSAGPVHWIGGDLINFPRTGARVNSFAEDRDGSVWMTRSRVHDRSGPLCHAINNEIECYSDRDGISIPYAGPLAVDLQGYVWMGSPSTLFRWKPGSYAAYVPKELERAEGLTGVNGIAVAPDNSLWVGIQRAGPGLGLERFTREQWHPFVTRELDGSRLEVTTLFLDGEHSLWVGTTKDGIYRVHDQKVDHFRHADGLSGDSVNCIFQDAEGTLWVATSRGIDSFHDLRITTYSTAEGLSSDRAASVVAAHDGTIWIANSGALDSIRDGRVSSIQRENGLPGTRVTALFEDHEGTLWVGVDNGLWRYQHGRFLQVTENGKPIGTTFGIDGDVYGDIWVNVMQNPRRMLRIRGNRVLEEVPSARVEIDSFVSDGSGLWFCLSNGDLGRYQDGQLETYAMKIDRDIRGVRGVYLDVNGGVWGVTGNGLVRRQNGEVKSLGARNGYVAQLTYALIVDADESLWAYTSVGLLKITRQQLNSWWKDPEAKIEVTRYDVFDGAQPASASFRPRVARSPDGRLWFANDNVVQVIDPSHIRTNPVPPTVQIEDIVADRKTYSIGEGLRLPPLTRELEIDYTGLSFIAPQKVHFRYILEGHDESWQEVGTRRQAFYSDLGPGKYRFRVIAANADGVWDESSTAVEFSVLPAYYQTPWFRLFCVITGLASLLFVYRLRLRQIGKSLNDRFEERMAERTRLARELHDTLLQTLQGSKLFADASLNVGSDAAHLRNTVASLSDWLDRAAIEVRSSLHSLRAYASQEDNLGEALRRAAEDCRRSTAVQVKFSTIGLLDSKEPEIHPAVQEEIYRIGYEAILNACRHSRAGTLEIRLAYRQDFSLSIYDDGQGIDPGIVAHGKDGHFGLEGMQERAKRINAAFTISSKIGGGTKVDLIVPAKIVFVQHNSWTSLGERIRTFVRASDQPAN